LLLKSLMYRIRTETHVGESVMIGATAVLFDASGVSGPVPESVRAGIEGVPGFHLYETIGQTPLIPPVPPTAPIRITVTLRSGELLGEAELLGTVATLLRDLPVPQAQAAAAKAASGKSKNNGSAPAASSSPESDADAKTEPAAGGASQGSAGPGDKPASPGAPAAESDRTLLLSETDEEALPSPNAAEGVPAA
jgi:hypothetical protein